MKINKRSSYRDDADLLHFNNFCSVLKRLELKNLDKKLKESIRTKG